MKVSYEKQRAACASLFLSNVYTALKGTHFFLIAVTVAGAVPTGARRLERLFLFFHYYLILYLLPFHQFFELS